jgi:peptidoglycan/xylan/chitin deacetylase (PgdA/CDA1 family)
VIFPKVTKARLDRLLGRGLRRVLLSTTSVLTQRPLLALTFDDGPDPRLTPSVLDVLRDRKVRATFLLVGDRVRQHPDLARQVLAEGHEVGLHGDRHVDMRGGSVAEQYRALRQGRSDIEALLGVRIAWFRPPYGKQEPRTVIACRLAGMRPLMWSTSAHDWRPDPIEHQLTHAASGLRPGAVVLLHDGSARIAEPPPPPPRTQPELLERLLDLMYERSLEPVTVSELCASGDPVRAQWFEQWLHH